MHLYSSFFIDSMYISCWICPHGHEICLPVNVMDWSSAEILYSSMYRKIREKDMKRDKKGKRASSGSDI